jgi:hypothetical protein
MHEGERDEGWLIHDHFTAEPHPAVLMFPLYVGVGKVAAATGRDVLQVYGALELAMRLAIPPAVYLFVSMLLPEIRARRFGFVLAVLGGSLTVWVGLLDAAFGLDLPMPGEPSVFPFFLSAPHLGLGLVATLLALACFIEACRGTRWAAWIMPFAVLLGWAINPYNLPALAVGFGAYGVLQAVRKRRILLRPLLQPVVAFAPVLPLLLYNALMFNLDPFWRQVYSVQNVMPSAAPWALPAEYGPLILLAPIGLWAARRTLTPAQQVTLAWLMAGVLLMYLPLPYQRRFASALWPPVAAFAVLGVPAMQRVLGIGVGRIIARTCAVLIFVTPLATYGVALVSAATNAPAAFYPVDRASYELGLRLVAQSGPDDVVLASWDTSNVLAGVLPGRVVGGHDAVTEDSASKKAAIAALYGGQLSSAQVRAFMAANRVTFVIVGENERKLGSYDPGRDLALSEAGRVGSAVAYRLPDAR